MSSKGKPGNRRRGRVTVVIIVIALILAGVAILQYSIDSPSDEKQGWDQSSPFDTTDSVLGVLGGVRESIAAYLWTKTDTLHHEYFSGALRKEQALFPYYWLITRLDPHFTIAYYYAGWMLCRFGLIEKGLELALEGARNNPSSAILEENLAQIYLFFIRDPEEARYHAVKAIQLADDPQDKDIYRSFLDVIDDVLAGESYIPPISTYEELEKITREEHHEHDHHHQH